MTPIQIEHFSDILCVWAYVSKPRMRELHATFGDEIEVRYRFVNVFGHARPKLEAKWADRGGLAAYGDYVRGLLAKYEEPDIHDDVWTKTVPRSSMSAHVFLTAVRVLERAGDIAPGTCDRARVETADWFFQRGKDISSRAVQLELAESLGVATGLIERAIGCGDAFEELSLDLTTARDRKIEMSPTLVLNEGRQRLNGNVGYRVIEANVRELRERPAEAHSWC
jgi:predicted DsbA family dithiol-disulfide isomerase